MKPDLELIEDYLDGTMGDADRRQFEARLVADPELARELSTQKLIHEGIQQAGRKELHGSLRDLEASLPPIEAETVPLWRNTWLRIAAAITVLAVCSYLLWTRQAGPGQLFDEYFDPYPNVIIPTVRGDVAADTTLKAKAYRAYDRKAYREAIEFFEKAEADEAVLLYLANSHLAAGDAERAIILLNRVIRDYDAFDEVARWYLCLAYLKAGRKDNAISEAAIVITDSGEFSREAELLVKRLKSIN